MDCKWEKYYFSLFKMGLKWWDYEWGWSRATVVCEKEKSQVWLRGKRGRKWFITSFGREKEKWKKRGRKNDWKRLNMILGCTNGQNTSDESFKLMAKAPNIMIYMIRSMN